MPTVPDLVLKQNDTWPPLTSVLTDANGAINLTTATSVTIHMKGLLGSTVTGACVVTDAPNGKVSYTWAVGDTAIVDTYNVEFAIVWTVGGEETVPSGGYNVVQIVAELA